MGLIQPGFLDECAASRVEWRGIQLRPQRSYQAAPAPRRSPSGTPLRTAACAFPAGAWDPFQRKPLFHRGPRATADADGNV